MMRKTMQAALIAFACGTASAQTGTTGTTTAPEATPTTTATQPAISSQYLKRSEARFGEFAGSRENLSSLVGGLRTGGEITLSDGVSFTSPTKPMGYGNITRSLDLAQRQLAAQGITQPTSEQLQAALMGGSITGPNGQTTTYAGVLQLRSEGMGWGKIAHTVGVHPGMGKSSASTAAGATTATAAGTSTGGTTAAAGASRGGIVTAGGARVHTASGLARGHGHAKVAAGGGSNAAFGATASAGGASALGAKVHGQGNTQGGGNGNAFGRGK